MKALTRESVDKLRKEIDKALAPVAKKHGLELTCGTCRIKSAGRLAFYVLDAAVADASEVAEDEAAEEFRKHAHDYGLEPDDLHEEITFTGTRFKIVGVDVADTFAPIRVVDMADHKAYKLPAGGVRRALEDERESLTTAAEENGE